MIFQGFKNNIIYPDVNLELSNLKGFLNETDGRVALVKFLRYNPGYAVELLTGTELFPFQRLLVRSMFVKDFFLAVLGRGFSKTWTASVFCFLYAVFNPGSKIGLISKTFRQSRLIFENIEKFANSPGGVLLRQCFGKAPSHRNEIWKMQIGTSEIIALPLGEGGKLRGFRFNVVVIDELLLLPENIVNEVILPFLSVNFDPKIREKTQIEEDDLVKRGIITNEERTVFPNPKFIGLSSASFQFEFLYKLYKEYVTKIYNPDPRDDNGKPIDTSGYGIFQMAYDVAPKHLYNEEFIARMKTSMSAQQFEREFGAVFTDDSGGYFSKKKMEECTIKPGNEPSIEIEGDSKAKYILCIDPSWSKAESSDHFAMSLIKLNEENKTGTVVHNYAVAGGQMQNHMTYLRYLLTSFNIVFVISDKAGSWFLEDANLSTIFAQANLKLEFMDADFFADDYAQALHQAKRSYDLREKRIVYGQYFSPPWIRRANEMLASSFDHKKMFFAAPAMDAKFEKMKETGIPYEELIYNPAKNELEGMARLADFIEHQTDLIDLVKNETSLIQLTNQGDSPTHRFTLPANIRNSDSKDKARRDNYTTLLLGNFAMKAYYDMLYAPKTEQQSFIPFFIR